MVPTDEGSLFPGMGEVGAGIVAPLCGPVEGEQERPSDWAKNQSELAEALGCDRKSIQRWLKEAKEEEDPECPCPGKTADGRYNITLWTLWVEKADKKVRAMSRGKSKGELALEGMRLKNDRMNIENMIRRGEMMHIDDVCKVLTEMTGAFAQRLKQMKHNLPPSVVGVSIPEATKRIGREGDDVLTELALGDWAKKKPFWSSVFAHLSGLQAKHSLGDGPSDTFATP